MINRSLFTSTRGDWETPVPLFKRLDDIFHFNLDVCANELNHKTRTYINEEIDALAGSDSWAHGLWEFAPGALMAWNNPPYGKGIRPWIQRSHDTYLDGGNVVCLLPARTDTGWFQDLVLRAPLILLMRGRVNFLLPCLICGASTERLYRLSTHWYEAHPKIPISYLGKTIPLCPEHKPDSRYAKRSYKSAATFPSCLAMFVHPSRLRSAKPGKNLSDLGTFVITKVPEYRERI